MVLGFTVLREVRAEKKHDWVDKALVYNVMVVLGLHSPGCDHSLICNHYSKQLHQRVLGLGIFFFFFSGLHDISILCCLYPLLLPFPPRGMWETPVPCSFCPTVHTDCCLHCPDPSLPLCISMLTACFSGPQAR